VLANLYYYVVAILAIGAAVTVDSLLSRRTLRSA